MKQAENPEPQQGQCPCLLPTAPRLRSEETWSHVCDVTMAMTTAGHLGPFSSEEALMPQII